MLEFDAKSHTYWINNVKCISVTQLIEQYKQEFDSEQEAERYSEKYGKTKDHWLKYWKNINEQSLLRGNDLHNLYEDITRNRSFDSVQGKILRVQNPSLFPQDYTLSKFPDGVYTEEPICHATYLIAGKPDRFAIETRNGRRYVYIDDYKSNRRLRTRSYYSSQTGYQMMKPPLAHLMDCELSHYTLQLSLYMFIFEYHGFKPGAMRLIHFPHIPEMAPQGAENPDPVFYDIPYMKSDVIRIIHDLKRKRRA